MAHAAADISEKVDDLCFTDEEEELLTAIIEELDRRTRGPFPDEAVKKSEEEKFNVLTKAILIAKKHAQEMRGKNFMIELKQKENDKLSAQLLKKDQILKNEHLTNIKESTNKYKNEIDEFQKKYKNEVDELKKKHTEEIDKIKEDCKYDRENLQSKIDCLKSKKSKKESEYKQKEEDYKSQIKELKEKLGNVGAGTSQKGNKFVNEGIATFNINERNAEEFSKREALKVKIEELKAKLSDAEKENKLKDKRIKKLEAQLTSHNELKQKYEETAKKNVEISTLNQTSADTHGKLMQHNLELQKDNETLTTQVSRLINLLNEHHIDGNTGLSVQSNPERIVSDLFVESIHDPSQNTTGSFN